ncbi:tyrosine recombinase XerC [uncultured Brevibacillus sp.]|uniref:site-specific integrase n=1 Tax=uncultured Brevibacillus sp. TaxID=169970 RepID=UPI002594CB06|nr:site-specific integrase [uncultured Brevibacillus sp.]
MAASCSKVGKKFRITYEYGKDASGKRQRSYETVETEAEAKRLVAEFNYKQQRNLLVMKNDITLADHLRRWMELYVSSNCQETTAYGYKNIIENHIIPYMGDTKLQDLQPATIQQYYHDLEVSKHLSPNSVRRHHALLRKALDFALKQQFVYRNVTEGVVQPKKRKHMGKSYTPEQVKFLLAKVKETKMDVPVHLAVCLGLRREEITGLRWEHVDLKNRILRIVEVRTAAGKNKNIIKEPKTPKSRRTLYIVDEVYDVLVKHKEWQVKRKAFLGDLYHDSGYVFVRDDGKPYRVNSVSEHFLDFLRKHGLPKIRLHDLRHTFASVMYEAGVDLKAISEMMGHSDIGTTSRIYTHMFDNTHKEKLSVMSKILSS